MKTMTTLCLILTFAFANLPAGQAKAQTVSTVSDGIFYDGFGIDSTGKIYCSNYAGTQVFTYDPVTENVEEFATGLTTPNGIGVTPDDEIYVCEATANRITVFDTNGNQINQFTGLNNPTGIKHVATTGELLWVSYNQSAIYTLNPETGESTLLTSGAPLNGPSGISFIDGQTYISNYNDRKIFRFEDNQSLIEIAQLPAGASQNNVCGFSAAFGDKIYATQIGEHRIYEIDPETGAVVLFSGSSIGNDDGDVDEATYNFPNGILSDDSKNRMYVSDAGTSNLRIIDDVNLDVDALAKADISIQLYPNPVKDVFYVNFFGIKLKAPCENLYYKKLIIN